MELASEALSAWIVSTQVGDPLAHCGKGGSHCISADGVVGLAFAAISDTEDEEISDFRFGRSDLTEGRGDALCVAEVGPEAKDFGLSSSMLASGSSGGEVERRAEISREEISDGNWSSCQGLSCG